MKNLKVKAGLGLVIMLMFLSVNKANGQFVISEVIKLTVTKIIKAIDLKVQRMQNKTIWLQNAQKVIENQLSKTKLTEISTWSDKQKQLYSNYYTELWKIKSAISYYQRIKDITFKQASLVTEYHQAWGMLRQDSHFNAQELNHMQQVYSGILDASVKNLNEILLMVNPYKTQMTDGQRLEMINHAGDHLDENYSDLHQFNNQNIQLSLQRSKDLDDTHSIKKLYGIN
jgi:hypothetical protein